MSDFVPHDHLLRHVRLMVTNGGWGGTLGALGHAVPLVLAGGDYDKPDIAARVGDSRAGLDLRTGSPTPATLRAAVQRVLGDQRFADAARRVSDDLAALGVADRAAALIETVLECD